MAELLEAVGTKTAEREAASHASRSRSDTSQPPQILLSSIDAKLWTALTGLALLGFVTFHMLGNLQIYLGQDQLNAYAAFLKSMPLLLWFARIGLLAVFVGHIGLAFYLRRMNRKARSVGYVYCDTVQASVASRTMLLSGLMILAFVIYHLLHFTLGVTSPNQHELIDTLGRHDVYSMVVLGFQNAFVSIAYIVAMLFLGLHLTHAASSIFQTLGLNAARWRKLVDRLGLGVAMVVVIGNCSIPAAVLLGFVSLPAGGTP